MGLEQQLAPWKPLSKNIYALRLQTRQHQRLQELKTQSTNQQHALAHSAFDSAFIDRQLISTVGFYDQQLTELEQAINALIQADADLKPRVERLLAIKGLGLLSVAVLVAETNGFEGFANQRQLVSYAGYYVVENQSGTHRGRTATADRQDLQKRQHGAARAAVFVGYCICLLLLPFGLVNRPVKLSLSGSTAVVRSRCRPM